MNLSFISIDWRKLYFGKVSPNEVKIAVSDVNWQKTRFRGGLIKPSDYR